MDCNHSASSNTAGDEAASEGNVAFKADTDLKDNIPPQPAPRARESDYGQRSHLLIDGHSEWPSGSTPLQTGADSILSSSNGLHSHSNLSEVACESDSLVVGYPVLVPAELGDTIWERGVNEEDIFLPRAEHSGAVLDSFCDESYWSFLLSANPESKAGRDDSRIQKELSAVHERDFDFALVLEYERERCLDGFADRASYASILEKRFGMNMNWSAPPMSIRKPASEPFIFPRQPLQEDYVAASMRFSAHDPVAASSIGIAGVVEDRGDRYAVGPSRESTKAVLQRVRSQSPKVLRDHVQAGTGEGSRRQGGSGRPSAWKSIRDPLSSTSPSRASPTRQATVSGEEVICAAAAPPVEADSHTSSCESHAACSHASSAAISRGSSPSRPSSRSPSRSSSSSDSSYAPSDAEGPTGTSRKRRCKQRTRPQAVKGSKADLHNNIPSSSVRDGKRKRATLASRQPPSTKADVNPANTAVLKRPRVYAVDRHGDIECPWPGCSHSAGVLQMRHHLSNKHRRPGDASSCYWPGCQASHFSSAPRHIDDYHLEIEWICPACNSTFKSERSGNRHIRRSCEAWQRVDVEEVKENWTSDDNGQRSIQSESKSLGNERPTKRRKI